MISKGINIPRIIMIADDNIGGYTVFFEMFPSIITEGDTMEKAINNLFDAFYDVYYFYLN